MDKKEYFKISKTDSLPKRCPILDKCERRIQTICLISYNDTSYSNAISIMEKEGDISDNYLSEKIKVRGEWPKYTDARHYNEMCPEVTLFDSYHQNQFGGTAVSSVTTYFDADDKKEKYDIDYKHYSECPEFSSWFLDTHKVTKRKSSRITASISKAMRFEIFQRDDFTCKYCGKRTPDGVKLEVDHIVPVSKGGKDIFENLVTACSICNLGKTDKSI